MQSTVNAQVSYLVRRRRSKHRRTFARQSQIEYATIFTKGKANNQFSLSLRGEYQGLQQIGLTYLKQSQLYVCIHVCSRSTNNRLACALIMNSLIHGVQK